MPAKAGGLTDAQRMLLLAVYKNKDGLPWPCRPFYDASLNGLIYKGLVRWNASHPRGEIVTLTEAGVIACAEFLLNEEMSCPSAH